MLTRKHMNALAEVVKDFPSDARLPVKNKDGELAWVDLSNDKASLAGKLANICANSNGAFDYSRFFEACEVDSDRAWSYT